MIDLLTDEQNKQIEQLSKDLAEHYSMTPEEAQYRLKHGYPSESLGVIV